MGIWSNLFRTARFAKATRPAVTPAEVGAAHPGNEWPEMTGDLLETLNAEGERRLLEQFGRRTAKQSKGNRP